MVYSMNKILHPKSDKLSIQLSPDMVDTDVEVVIMPLREQRRKKAYDYTNLAGKLQWRGDAVKEQRKLRDEW